MMDSRTYFEKDLRKLKECDDIYNMPRQSKYNIGKEESETMGKYR